MVMNERATNLVQSVRRNLASRVSRFDLNYRWESYVLAFGMVFVFVFVSAKLVAGFPGSVFSPTAADELDTGETIIVRELKARTVPDTKATPEEIALLSSELSGKVSPSPYAESFSGPEEELELAAATSLPSTKSKGDSELACHVVEEFYQNLNGGNLDSAYQQLSPAFTEVLSYQRFRLGYQSVESLTCQIKHSESIAPEKVRLDVEITVSEAGRESKYLATCLVVRFDQTWRLDAVAQIES